MFQSFINTDPSRTKHDAETRKQIRSLVMRQVSEKKRKQSKGSSDQAQDSDDETARSQSQHSQQDASPSATSSSSTPPSRTGGQFLMVKFDGAKNSASQSSRKAKQKQKRQRVKANTSVKRQQRAVEILKVLPQSAPVFPNGRISPISNFPVPGQPYMHYVLAHYTTVVENGKTPVGQINPLVAHWMPLAWSDPAAFHSLMSVACVAYAAMYERQLSGLRGFYHQGQAVKLINSALSDPKRGVSDAVTSAVINSAIYEALIGNRPAWEAHMVGLVTMVKIRGGMDNLGHDGFIEQMAYWADDIGGLTLRIPTRFFPKPKKPEPSSSSGPPTTNKVLGDTIAHHNKQIEAFWTDDDTGENQWSLHHSQFEKVPATQLVPTDFEISAEEESRLEEELMAV